MSDADETEEQKRERVMRRLAEILQGPPPELGPMEAPVRMTGSVDEALSRIELDAEATEMLQAMLASFSEWQGSKRETEPEEE
jgi:hypothetical protein